MFARMGRWAVGGVLLPFVMMMLVVGSALGASPSDLLEKAIYTEETVGDLDEAIKLYEQVIAEGKTAQEAAAQAQFRLAKCYQKKGRDAEATTAFEELIESYPNETELIAEARKHLPSTLSLLPAPWVEGERMQGNLKMANGLDIGTMVYRVEAAEHDGKAVTRCATQGLVTVNDSMTFSEVLCETESFAPIESVWKHSLLGEAEAKYGDSSATINVVGKEDSFTVDFTPPAFDNEQCVQLFRRLPLEEGYKTTLTVVTSLGSGKLELPITVSKVETLTVPAGTYECYKIELAVVGQTFWISTDKHRYVVKFAAGGASSELARVWHVESGQTEKVRGEGFSLTLPEDWVSYSADPDSDSSSDEGERVYLLDPRVEARTRVVVRPKDTLKEAQRESTTAWTESFLEDFKKSHADSQVREPGLVEQTVGGRSATVMVADFTKGGKKMSLVGVAVFSETSAANISMTIEASKLEELRPAFDTIVESFQLD